MTERLKQPDWLKGSVRRKRLAFMVRGLRRKMGAEFRIAWSHAKVVFECRRVLRFEGRGPSPYSLEEPQDVRMQRLLAVRADKDSANCIKLYQAIRRVKAGPLA